MSGEFAISFRSGFEALMHLLKPVTIGEAASARMGGGRLEIACKMTGARMKGCVWKLVRSTFVGGEKCIANMADGEKSQEIRDGSCDNNRMRARGIPNDTVQYPDHFFSPQSNSVLIPKGDDGRKL